MNRSEEHTSELQSPCNLVCRLLLEKKKQSKGSKVKLHCHHHRQVYARCRRAGRWLVVTISRADVLRAVFMTLFIFFFFLKEDGPPKYPPSPPPPPSPS